MRFYLGYINHLGRLQKKSARLVRQAHQPVRQAGFSVTEVLLASLMMLIAISVAGIGVTNLLRSNYRANAGTEIQNNLNRTLEFVSDDLRRARIIVETEANIVTTKVPQARAAGARPVLAFQISDPNNPGQAPLNEQIVYYTQNSQTGDSLTGLVLWRYGPNLDPNGNYTTPDDILTWQHSPVTDRLAEDAVNPSCPADFNKISNPISNPPQGFFACVHKDGNQVILNADAQIKMTTNDEVKYSVNTRVFTRACQTFCLTSPTPTTPPTTTPTTTPTPTSPPYYVDRGGGTQRPLTIPVLTVAATVKAEVIVGKTCTFGPSCGVVAAPQLGLSGREAEEHFDSNVNADAFDNIVVFVDGLRNDETATQTLVYTSKSSNLPSNIKSLTNNQILFVLTSKTNSSTSYQILVTITPN